MHLTQKRQLSAALKALHGKQWNRKMLPIYDERNLPAVYIESFNDLDTIGEVAKFPIHWMELTILKESTLDAVQEAIPILMRGAANWLEFLQINYILDVDAKNHAALRQVLPESGDEFENLPRIDRVVFNRINFSDKHLEALCCNPSLRDVDIRLGDVTKKIAKPLSKLERLEFLELDSCAAIPPDMLEWFQQQLPRVRIIRIR
jgi:hypothetical protein